MKLYGVRGYGSAITEAMLALAGIAYEFMDVSGFDEPGDARDRLAAVNPLAQVPALVLDDGMVLTETAAITLYLADQFAGLAPAVGTVERVRFYRLLIWLVANVYPTFTYGDYPARWSPAATAALVAATDRAREGMYGWLEAQVTGRFVLGEAMCALDVYVAVLVTWRPGRRWFQVNTPKLERVAAAVREVPVVAGVLERNGIL